MQNTRIKYKNKHKGERKMEEYKLNKEEKSGIKTVINLVCRLTDLCEGFDESNKNCIISTKFKILFTIDKYTSVTPTILKEEVSIAKSNLAILCKKFEQDGEIIKIKDAVDGRCVRYKLTAKGKKYLQNCLELMEKNFVTAVGYKNNLQDIKTCANKLVCLVNKE